MTPFSRTHLHSLEHELGQSGEQLRALGHRLRRHAETVRWSAPAAAGFETALSGVLGQLGRFGDQVDELATTLRSHGDRAAQRATELADPLRSGLRALRL